jgi:hypothetical protein
VDLPVLTATLVGGAAVLYYTVRHLIRSAG